MPNRGIILRNAIKRLRASGRTWQEIAQQLGFKNPGIPSLILTKHWKPKPDRLEKMMRELPRELWQTTKELRSAILQQLKTQHIGIENAVQSRYLALQHCTTDRMIRATMEALRNEHHPICSSVGKPRGFYWPRSMREYKEFRHRDYQSRINKMEKTRDAMDMGAEAMFEGKRLVVAEQAQLMET